jgi:hypothetical protein
MGGLGTAGVEPASAQDGGREEEKKKNHDTRSHCALTSEYTESEAGRLLADTGGQDVVVVLWSR